MERERERGSVHMHLVMWVDLTLSTALRAANMEESG
jgi:hypothetical protein